MSGPVMDSAQAITEAVGVALADHAERVEQRFAEMRDELIDRVRDYVSSLPPPEPARDGLDRILALPRYVKAGESCDPNVIAWAEAGIWQSVRATSGGPRDDPSGWKCLVPGVAAIETREDWPARELVIGLRMSDGVLHECRGRMPATRLPPDYLERGWGVLAGDTLRPAGEDNELMALIDGAALGRVEDWQETRLRGFRGQKVKGDKGDRGDRGPGLAGLSLVEGPTGLAIVPRYQDPAITAEPIAVDLLIEDPPPGLDPITGFAGMWNAGRTYRRGEVVSSDGRLVLSIKPENNTRPDDPSGWRVMV